MVSCLSVRMMFPFTLSTSLLLADLKNELTALTFDDTDDFSVVILHQSWLAITISNDIVSCDSLNLCFRCLEFRLDYVFNSHLCVHLLFPLYIHIVLVAQIILHIDFCGELCIPDESEQLVLVI